MRMLRAIGHILYLCRYETCEKAPSKDKNQAQGLCFLCACVIKASCFRRRRQRRYTPFQDTRCLQATETPEITLETSGHTINATLRWTTVPEKDVQVIARLKASRGGGRARASKIGRDKRIPVSRASQLLRWDNLTPGISYVLSVRCATRPGSVVVSEHVTTPGKKCCADVFLGYCLSCTGSMAWMLFLLFALRRSWRVREASVAILSRAFNNQNLLSFVSLKWYSAYCLVFWKSWLRVT